MDEGPGRRTLLPENTGIILVDPGEIEGPGHFRGEEGERRTRPVDHRDREHEGDILPPLPPMKRLETIGAHDPDEMYMGIASLDPRQRLRRECGAECLL